ncbi:hypothetical protein, partial [Paraburkholderia graminis]|uniref:hypothetical protein n=2 Tax=Paraburkholderia graminis TaxID=60548 RepID=UPI0038BD0583
VDPRRRRLAAERHLNTVLMDAGFRARRAGVRVIEDAIMKTMKAAVLCSALALASVSAAFAQGAGGGGSGGGGGTSVGAGGAGVGGANGAGQGGAGMNAPNSGGTAGATSMSKGSHATIPPTRKPQKDAQAKGASDTAASSAQ